MPGDNYSQNEAEVTLGLLKAIEGDEALTQRSAASELGVALGLVNTYLKRCVKKGFIKVTQAPSNRYAYYLTPHGFAEKSRLTAEFLTQSLSLFRQAQQEYSELLEQCVAHGWKEIVLYGVSDLAEILALYARDYPLTIKGLVDRQTESATCAHLPVVKELATLGPADAYIITDLNNPQPVYDELVKKIPCERILVPKLLEISRNKPGGEAP